MSENLCHSFPHIAGNKIENDPPMFAPHLLQLLGNKNINNLDSCQAQSNYDTLSHHRQCRSNGGRVLFIIASKAIPCMQATRTNPLGSCQAQSNYDTLSHHRRCRSNGGRVLFIIANNLPCMYATRTLWVHDKLKVTMTRCLIIGGAAATAEECFSS